MSPRFGGGQMDVVQTDVDGVPAVWVPSSGPMRAGLVFRVGRADETLVTGGITHVLEHLALHTVGAPYEHFNGMTGATAAMFVTQGSADELCAFFATVTAGLRDPSAERLATEKSIIRTEAQSRESGVTDLLTLWRYGPVGYGVSA